MFNWLQIQNSSLQVRSCEFSLVISLMDWLHRGLDIRNRQSLLSCMLHRNHRDSILVISNMTQTPYQVEISLIKVSSQIIKLIIPTFASIHAQHYWKQDCPSWMTSLFPVTHQSHKKARIRSWRLFFLQSELELVHTLHQTTKFSWAAFPITSSASRKNLI